MKRYDFDCNGHRTVEPDGDYVYFDKAQAEIARRDALIKRMHDLLCRLAQCDDSEYANEAWALLKEMEEWA